MSYRAHISKISTVLDEVYYPSCSSPSGEVLVYFLSIVSNVLGNIAIATNDCIVHTTLIHSVIGIQL